MSFREVALANRHQLIVAIRYLEGQRGSSAANTAYQITQKAIQWGYTEPREAPKGNTLDMWIKRREVPAWAAKAVARMLLEEPGFELQNPDQGKALALMLAEALPDCEANDLIKQIPVKLQATMNQSLIDQACGARK